MNHMPQPRPGLAGTERVAFLVAGGHWPGFQPDGFPLLQWFLQGEKSRGIWVCTLVRGQPEGFPLSTAILPTCGGSARARVSRARGEGGRSHI